MVSFPLLFGYTWGSREEWRSRKNTSSPKFSWTCLALMKTHSHIQYLFTKCLLHARSYAGCWRLNREQNRKNSAGSLHFSGRSQLWWCCFHKLWFMSVTISLVTVWSIDWGGPRAEAGDSEAAPVVRQAGAAEIWISTEANWAENIGKILALFMTIKPWLSDGLGVEY